jgi:hypothetical protein
MLDPDPGTRWSMAEAAEALRKLAAAEAAATPDTGPVPIRDGRPPDTVPTAVAAAAAPERRRRPALLALGVLLLLVLVAGAGWWLTQDPQDGTGNRSSGGASGQPSETQPTEPSGRPSHQHSSQSTGEPSSQPSGQPSAEPSSAPSSSSSSVGGTAGSPTGLVADYYEVLPEDTDAAWAMLTPALQDRIGRDTFVGFWATIDDVRMNGTDEVGDGVVQVTLTYVTDGRAEEETRQLEVDRAGDGFLISADDGPV